MVKQRIGERLAWQFAWFFLALIPITVVALWADPRLVNDISVWIKPLKFELSLVLHLATLGVLMRYLPEEKRQALWLSLVLSVIAIASFTEIVVITLQSLRGVASHFNDSTTFDRRVYQLMGVGALLLTLLVIAIGVRFATVPPDTTLTRGLKLGAALGLILGALLTFLIAGYLSMQSSGHWVAAPETDAGGLPLTGWSRNGGDLRVPHFFATHLMQVLPLVGWIADRRCGASSLWPSRIVWTIAAASTLLVALTFTQARAGHSLF